MGLVARGLERVLPVKSGERRLSPTASHMVYTGFTKSFRYEKTLAAPNDYGPYRWSDPYTFRIQRSDPDTGEVVDFNTGRSRRFSNEPLDEAIAELNHPEVVARVQRVERTAERVRTVALAAGAVAIVAGSILTGGHFHHSAAGMPLGG